MSLVARKSSSVGLGGVSTNVKRNISIGNESDTIHSIPFDRSKSLTGSNQAVCKTEAEYKAGKLNRTEEVRLQQFKFQVAKAEQIQRRQYQHTEHILRAKSAKLASKMKGIEDSWSQTQQKTSPKPKLLQSRVNECGSDQTKCRTCAQLQTVIQLYEREGRQRGIVRKSNAHSTCMFSNDQFKMFLKMLEAKYLPEIPGLKVKLRETEATSLFVQNKDDPPLSRRQVELCLALRDVQMRIQNFCSDLDRFNKRNGTVSRHICESVERVRMSNAVVRKDGPEPKRLNMREEVERLFKL